MRDVLDGLDDAQRVAVTHPAGPLLVTGGAGTGKTLTLMRRFVWLVEQGAPPGSVLALTPSAAAATEMRERLETLIDTPYEELAVATPQGLCGLLLQEHALEAGLDPFFTTVTPADRLALLSERIDDLALRRHEIRGNPIPLLGSFISRIDRLKEQMASPADVLRNAEELVATAEDDAARIQAARELEFAEVYATHDRLLAEAGVLDLGDLILHAFRLLHESPQVRRSVAQRLTHVLVDEYEDTSFAQNMLLRLLVAEHREVCVAGGEHEAIGRPRGTPGHNLEDFTREYPDATVVRLEQSHRSPARVLKAAGVVATGRARPANVPRGRTGGRVRFWRCASERAQAQAVAGEVERLLTRAGATPDGVAVLVRSVRGEGAVVASALEERAIPSRLSGAAAYFDRAEVRDLLAWLRLLMDPGDAGAVVRALSRPPVDLRSVDLARLTQLARRRKLDMVSAAEAACEGPQLSPEGRDRVLSFLRLYRSAAVAFEGMRPDAFVHRLIERIGLRRQQLYAAQAETLERLVNIAKFAELAVAYGRREPRAGSRDFARYVAAVAEAGLSEEEAELRRLVGAVTIMAMDAAKGLEFDHVFVLGLNAATMPGPYRPGGHGALEALPAAPIDGRDAHDARARRLLHVAMTRARKQLVLGFARTGAEGPAARPSPFLEEARAALGAEEENFEEELFGPAEGLHSTFRMMRDEVLDSVARVGHSLREMRLDTYIDIAQATVRYLELVKVAALIERAKDGEEVGRALPEINELLLQAATPEQREAFLTSSLDDYLRDAEGDARRRAATLSARSEQSLDTFIPRRGEGVMLSASDIETYRLCPLKYKFARVYRIPQEPTINQRFGIVVHQVLERFHTDERMDSLDDLMALFEAAWRRSGFGESDDEAQFRARAVSALRRYWELDREREGHPVWFERSFSFKVGPHLLRGRVDRVDRLPGGGYELIDYKTGKAKTAGELREDIQLSLYRMGARDSWRLETSAQSYYYVLDNRKVPVEHSDAQLERVRGAIGQIAEGIKAQSFEPKPSPAICPSCDYRIICPAAEK